jgi:hypothetical protein
MALHPRFTRQSLAVGEILQERLILVSETGGS